MDRAERNQLLKATGLPQGEIKTAVEKIIDIYWNHIEDRVGDSEGPNHQKASNAVLKCGIHNVYDLDPKDQPAIEAFYKLILSYLPASQEDLEAKIAETNAEKEKISTSL